MNIQPFIHVGKYIVRRMDSSWEILEWCVEVSMPKFTGDVSIEFRITSDLKALNIHKQRRLEAWNALNFFHNMG